MKTSINIIGFMFILFLINGCVLFMDTFEKPQYEFEKGLRKSIKKYGGKVDYDRYSGKMELIKSDSFTLVILDSTEIKVPIKRKMELSLIESRLLPKSVLNGHSRVCCISLHDIDFIKSTTKVRRYRLSVSNFGIVGSTDYYIELTNKMANKSTTSTEFIEGSKLSFISILNLRL